MNKVDKIKPGDYTGYFWESDSKEPEIVNGSFDQDLNPNKNPFIIEAQLYDRNTMLSYSIKYIDGEYLIMEHQVAPLDFNNKDIEIKDFYAHRMKDYKRLQFLQYWQEVEDDLCEGMKVLQPVELVFVGFNDNKEE